MGIVVKKEWFSWSASSQNCPDTKWLKWKGEKEQTLQNWTCFTSKRDDDDNDDECSDGTVEVKGRWHKIRFWSFSNFRFYFSIKIVIFKSNVSKSSTLFEYVCAHLNECHFIHFSRTSVFIFVLYCTVRIIMTLLQVALNGCYSASSQTQHLLCLLPFRTFPSTVRWNSPALSRKQARSCGYRSRLVLEPRPPVAGLRSSPRTWSMVGQSSLARAALAASPFCLESV